jgi:hypothetical protein
MLLMPSCILCNVRFVLYLERCAYVSFMLLLSTFFGSRAIPLTHMQG